jgi:hypothetical protein
VPHATAMKRCSPAPFSVRPMLIFSVLHCSENNRHCGPRPAISTHTAVGGSKRSRIESGMTWGERDDVGERDDGGKQEGRALLRTADKKETVIAGSDPQSPLTPPWVVRRDPGSSPG